jgi:hypothetical protein
MLKAASEYQVKVPVPQFALKVELSPTQIDDGLAATFTGATGVGTTITVTFSEGLLHSPFTQEAQYVLVIFGPTGEVTALVKPASRNHVNVPVAQVPLNVEVC